MYFKKTNQAQRLEQTYVSEDESVNVSYIWKKSLRPSEYKNYQIMNGGRRSTNITEFMTRVRHC